MQIHNNFYSSCYICHRKVLCLILAKKGVQNYQSGLDICEVHHNTDFVIMHFLKLHEDFIQ